MRCKRGLAKSTTNLAGRNSCSAPYDFRLRSLGAACAAPSRRRRTTTAWTSELAAEATTVIERAAWSALVHAAAAAEVAALTESLLVLILGKTLQNVETFAADSEGVGSYSGLEGLWASKVDKCAVLVYISAC
jgi:hypothetical protein